jgi:hypothetical protein
MISSILKIVEETLKLIFRYFYNKDAANTPEKRRDDDVTKFDQALDHGSDTDVSVMLDDVLTKTDNKNHLGR